MNYNNLPSEILDIIEEYTENHLTNWHNMNIEFIEKQWNCPKYERNYRNLNHHENIMNFFFNRKFYRKKYEFEPDTRFSLNCTIC